jgi:RNA polymerase sigma factor (sigma-70 family)
MASAPGLRLLPLLRELALAGDVGGATDGQLLEWFLALRHEAAFRALVDRHGPMVLGVCRRVLGDAHDAEDAFQATFLVLVRKAASVVPREFVANWLYGVACRTAHKARVARARADALKRRASERGTAMAGRAPTEDELWHDLQPVLDEELQRLPDTYCAAVVLCDLEGLPHEEAARRLGCPVGTVESRLSRGRQRLRDRLVRRGLAPAAAALWAETVREASAAMPAALIKQTARLVTSSPAAGAVPAAVAALAEGVIQMMWLARLKPLAAATAALVLATVGVGVLGQQQPAPQGAGAQHKSAPPPAAGAGVAVVPNLPANRALAREQLALIDKAEADLHRLALGGEIRFNDASFSMWGRRRLETLRTAGAGKAEIVAALEKHLDRLKKDEGTVQKGYQQGVLTGAETYDVQFRRMEAEIWLNEEKAR